MSYDKARYSTYAKLRIVVQSCPSCLLEDMLGKVLHIMLRVGIVEPLIKSVDEDTGVWPLDLDIRIGTILAIQR